MPRKYKPEIQGISYRYNIRFLMAFICIQGHDIYSSVADLNPILNLNPKSRAMHNSANEKLY